MNKALHEWTEFRESSKVKQVHGITIRVEGKAVWKAPERGVVRLNFSSETTAQGKVAGVGIVARDHNGNML